MKYNPQSNLERDTLPLSPAASVKLASAMVKVDLAAQTHRGHFKSLNEDHYLALRFGRSLETLSSNITESDLETGFNEVGYGMVVADGMGGRTAGDLASLTALIKLVELVVNTPDWVLNIDRRENMSTVMQRMTQRFRHIDDE